MPGLGPCRWGRDRKRLEAWQTPHPPPRSSPHPGRACAECHSALLPPGNRGPLRVSVSSSVNEEGCSPSLPGPQGTTAGGGVGVGERGESISQEGLWSSSPWLALAVPGHLPGCLSTQL